MEQVFSLSSLPQVATDFWSITENARVFAFHGDMGAGKTTFINALGAAIPPAQHRLMSPVVSVKVVSAKSGLSGAPGTEARGFSPWHGGQGLFSLVQVL